MKPAKKTMPIVALAKLIKKFAIIEGYIKTLKAETPEELKAALELIKMIVAGALEETEGLVPEGVA